VIKYHQQQKDLGDDEVIYFCDAVHSQHNTNATYIWIQKGLEKEIKSNTVKLAHHLKDYINLNHYMCRVNIKD